MRGKRPLKKGKGPALAGYIKMLSQDDQIKFNKETFAPRTREALKDLFYANLNNSDQFLRLDRIIAHDGPDKEKEIQQQEAVVKKLAAREQISATLLDVMIKQNEAKLADYVKQRQEEEKQVQIQENLAKQQEQEREKINQEYAPEMERITDELLQELKELNTHDDQDLASAETPPLVEDSLPADESSLKNSLNALDDLVNNLDTMALENSILGDELTGLDNSADKDNARSSLNELKATLKAIEESNLSYEQKLIKAESELLHRVELHNQSSTVQTQLEEGLKSIDDAITQLSNHDETAPSKSDTVDMEGKDASSIEASSTESSSNRENADIHEHLNLDALDELLPKQELNAQEISAQTAQPTNEEKGNEFLEKVTADVVAVQALSSELEKLSEAKAKEPEIRPIDHEKYVQAALDREAKERLADKAQVLDTVKPSLSTKNQASPASLQPIAVNRGFMAQMKSGGFVAAVRQSVSRLVEAIGETAVSRVPFIRQRMEKSLSQRIEVAQALLNDRINNPGNNPKMPPGSGDIVKSLFQRLPREMRNDAADLNKLSTDQLFALSDKYSGTAESAVNSIIKDFVARNPIKTNDQVRQGGKDHTAGNEIHQNATPLSSMASKQDQASLAQALENRDNITSFSQSSSNQNAIAESEQELKSAEEAIDNLASVKLATPVSVSPPIEVANPDEEAKNQLDALNQALDDISNDNAIDPNLKSSESSLDAGTSEVMSAERTSAPSEVQAQDLETQPERVVQSPEEAAYIKSLMAEMQHDNEEHNSASEAKEPLSESEDDFLKTMMQEYEEEVAVNKEPVAEEKMKQKGSEITTDEIIQSLEEFSRGDYSPEPQMARSHERQEAKTANQQKSSNSLEELIAILKEFNPAEKRQSDSSKNSQHIQNIMKKLSAACSTLKEDGVLNNLREDVKKRENQDPNAKVALGKIERLVQLVDKTNSAVNSLIQSNFKGQIRNQIFDMKADDHCVKLLTRVVDDKKSGASNDEPRGHKGP